MCWRTKIGTPWFWIVLAVLHIAKFQHIWALIQQSMCIIWNLWITPDKAAKDGRMNRETTEFQSKNKDETVSSNIRLQTLEGYSLSTCQKGCCFSGYSHKSLWYLKFIEEFMRNIFAFDFPFLKLLLVVTFNSCGKVDWIVYLMFSTSAKSLYLHYQVLGREWKYF